TGKRNPARLPAALHELDTHATRFLAAYPRFAQWQLERVAIAPQINADLRREIAAQGALVQDLNDLTAGLAT
ncbi:MAG: ATP-binding protein, partial [Rhodanobacteraceae bacterium]|nr:ATP-binding protein [Rhodanobacteraceae bacterium]